MAERREAPHHLVYPLLLGSQSCVLYTICCTDDEITFSHLTSLSSLVSASCVQEGFELWSPNFLRITVLLSTSLLVSTLRASFLPAQHLLYQEAGQPLLGPTQWLQDR